jgi:hypothetical protein
MLGGKGEIGGSVKAEKIECGMEIWAEKLYRAELKVLHLASSGLLVHHWEGIGSRTCWRRGDACESIQDCIIGLPWKQNSGS